MRLGINGLSLLAVPLNAQILQALAEEDDLPLTELNRAIGHPPATTTREYLRNLSDWGIVSRRQEAGFPGGVSYAIAPAGAGMLAVADVLRRWLGSAPEGAIPLGSTGAKSAVKALVDGWSTGLMRALAARPFALTELSRLIPQTTYPTLERRLTAMRRVGMLRASRSGNRGTLYEILPWLRQGIAPLSTAAHWEHRFAPERAQPIGKVDVEAMFLLAVPLLELPPVLSGSCRLGVELRSAGKLEFAGVTATFEQGRLASCVTHLNGEADAWATGTALGWIRSLSGAADGQVELGGDASLASAVIDGLAFAVVTP